MISSVQFLLRTCGPEIDSISSAGAAPVATGPGASAVAGTGSGQWSLVGAGADFLKAADTQTHVCAIFSTTRAKFWLLNNKL